MASLPKTFKNLCILNDSTMGLRPRHAKSLKIHRFLKGGDPSENLQKPVILNDSTMGLRPRQAKSLQIHRFFKGGEPSKNLQKPKDFEPFSYGPQEIVQNGRRMSTWQETCDFGYVFGAESLQEL